MKYIYELPDDINNQIIIFIPLNKLVFINKTYYDLYHYTIRDTIPLYENYVRDIIRRDNHIIFEKVIEENIDFWLKNRQYRYKNMNFNNYIYFIVHFCIKNKSEGCIEIVHKYLKNRDLCKNLHKKNVVKYIKWTN